MSKMKPGFRTFRDCGFHMTFANGWSISVQFSDKHYSDASKHERGGFEAPNAEVAVFDANGGWVLHGPNKEQVLGWQTPEQVLGMMRKIALKK